MDTENRFYVMAEITCKECNGSGIVVHPAWKQLRAEHPGPLTDARVREFMDYYEGAEMPVPDEEVRCYECEGRGFVERRVLLVEALRSEINASWKPHVQAIHERIDALAVRFETEPRMQARVALLESVIEFEKDVWSVLARKQKELEIALRGMALRTELQGEKNYLNERLDLELEIIQRWEERLDALNEKLSAYERWQGRQDDSLAEMSDTSDGLLQRLRDVEAGMASLKKVITSLHEVWMDKIEQRLDVLEAHAVETDDTLSILDGRVTNDAIAGVERLQALEKRWDFLSRLGVAVGGA